jgi:hypothetical protein
MLHTAGRDWVADSLGKSASRPAVADYLGLTANTTAPASGDTTLTGEIATAGGGLIRKQGTYGHTPGASTYTITATFTGNGSDTYPVVIGKVGVFNAATSGTMPWSSLLSPTATISASGDQLILTETITIS